MRRLFEHADPKKPKEYRAVYIRNDATIHSDKERVEALKALYVYYFCDDPHNGSMLDVAVLESLSALVKDKE